MYKLIFLFIIFHLSIKSFSSQNEKELLKLEIDSSAINKINDNAYSLINDDFEKALNLSNKALNKHL